MSDKRTAVLLDAQGNEIYRGPPAAMPVRFVDSEGGVTDWTMQDAVSAGTPIESEGEHDGDDMSLHDDDC